MSETGFIDNWCANFRQEGTDQDQFAVNTEHDESPTGYPVGDSFFILT